MKKLTQKRLKELFHYDNNTGNFINKHRRNRQAGKGDIAGSVDVGGYNCIGIGGKIYKAHRLVWLYHYGKWPNQIDHVNHDRLDNRIENLRDVGYPENTKNKGVGRNNNTGIVGVGWNKDSSKWRVRIGVKKVEVFLGYFHDFFEACCARKSAEVKYNFHPNHGKNL